MSNNIRSYQVNYGIGNELNFDSSNSLFNIPVKDPLTIVAVSLRGGKNSR